MKSTFEHSGHRESVRFTQSAENEIAPESFESAVPHKPAAFLDKRLARPSWDDYFMEIAKQVATRSTCLRRRVGAVIVHNKRIIATGYNGTASGLAHCIDIGCLREKLGIPSGQQHELCRGIHAEQNAIIQAARYGLPIDGSALYCTTQPCTQCTKMLLNAGIKEIIFAEGYPDKLALDLIEESGIVVRHHPMP